MTRIRLVILVGVTLLVIGGCASPPKEIVKPRNLSLDEVLSRVRERYRHIRTLHGDGSITVESRQASQSGSFDVDLKKPDSVLVDLHGPFGLHVGTLSLSRDRFIFYDKMQNNAVIGRPDGKTLQAMFHLAMGFDELLDAFTGEFPLSTGDDSLEQFSVVEGLYVATFRHDTLRKEYRIDGDSFMVTSYRILDDAGKATMIASASKPMEAGDFTMPRLVRVIFPAERRAVTIAYDNITLNLPVDCSFSLPQQAGREYR